MHTEFSERLAALQRVRDELREDLDCVNDSVRWLRAELRVVAPPPRRFSPLSIVGAGCGLGALLGAGLAMWPS